MTYTRARRPKSDGALGICPCGRASLSKVCWFVLPFSLVGVMLNSSRNLAAWKHLAARSQPGSETDLLAALDLSGGQSRADRVSHLAQGDIPAGVAGTPADAPGLAQQTRAPLPPYSERPSAPPALVQANPPPREQGSSPAVVVAQAPAPPAPAPATAAPAAAPKPAEEAAPSPSETVWIFCAEQWQECWCRGTVRWGNGDRWHQIKQKRKGEELQVKCSVMKLPDVAPGDAGKHCQCGVEAGSDYHKSLNPGLLHGGSSGSSAGAHLATSCEKLEAGAKDGDWGASMWEASEAFCSPSWETSGKGTKAGPRAIAKDKLRDMMLSWVDGRFVGNYKRFFDASGWAPRGFLNYYAGPPGGKHTKMTEELVKSVHLFSKEPIVVFHFGLATPTSWTAERFPQLVLMHAMPIPTSAQRSFNFNKFRAMILSRVRIGVQLDSDQFVAPGVDAIFPRTEEEITKDYAFPILPVHFLDRSPKDLGAYWARYCPKDNCRWQTTRWGHAHPTWTFWALPFLGRWLRRNFRDEWLPALKDGQMSALRVVNIPEDEDLLNVGTWEEGGTKQWCKLDLPGPGDFESLLAGRADSRDCKHWSCGDITADRRWHPRGAAKVFYTAHHAVDPAETKRYVERLKQRSQDSKGLPPPILYRGKFYASGQEMKAAHPDVACII